MTMTQSHSRGANSDLLCLLSLLPLFSRFDFTIHVPSSPLSLPLYLSFCVTFLPICDTFTVTASPPICFSIFSICLCFSSLFFSSTHSSLPFFSIIIPRCAFVCFLSCAWINLFFFLLSLPVTDSLLMDSPPITTIYSIVPSLRLCASLSAYV